MSTSALSSTCLFKITTLLLSASHFYASAEILAGNAASRALRGQGPALVEEAASIDLGFLNVPDAPNMSKVANQDLENQVTDLFKMAEKRKAMTQEEFEKSPMGGALKKIFHIIENVMMPKVVEAHNASQMELNTLAADAFKCGTTKNAHVKKADSIKAQYLKFAPLHRTCRAAEAGVSTTRTACWEEEADKKKIMQLKCGAFKMVKREVGNQQASKQIMMKGGSESVGSYVDRVTATVCGSCVGKGCKLGKFPAKGKKCGYAPYTCGCGVKCKYDKAKDDCDAATADWKQFNKQCRADDKTYADRKAACDSLQDQTDGAACKTAVSMKDACEMYAECHFDKMKAYVELESMVKIEEKDRHIEWRGLKRMKCLMQAFNKGKVSDEDIATCRKIKTSSVDHLEIDYPKNAPIDNCEVPKNYPNTPTYKLENFARLPMLAKGKPDAYECTGLQEISTTPAAGSPPTCKCARVTLNGPYSAGPVVKCVHCHDIRRSTEKNSCPEGTKIFSPRSRTDWKTFLSSTEPLRAPHWIIDITRPENHCGGCKKPMNSQNHAQKSWKTVDGSAWWLRSTEYKGLSGDYHANCYMNLKSTSFANENNVTFGDQNCDYHSKSYYCQASQLHLAPKSGSPPACQCKEVTLTGKYSAGSLIKCTGCLKVSKSLERNSCPVGTKIFSPRTRADWKTFIESAAPLRSPDFIIDITQATKGCGGCNKHAMNSHNFAQATWRTSDNTPWFLRSSKYSEPSEASSYHANCYMDLVSAVSEDSVTFSAKKCDYSSNAYYCQPVKKKIKKVEPEVEEPEPKGPPPAPESGEDYEGLKCADGAYTGLPGLNGTCGNFLDVSDEDCSKACDESSSALGKESCDKVTGVPKCVASVYDRQKKVCILHRACTQLVEWEGHEDVVTRIKPSYSPASKTFSREENVTCKGEAYTAPDGDLMGFKDSTEAECWEACFANKWSGKKDVPLELCAAAAYNLKTKYCDLYKQSQCESTKNKSGFVLFTKLETSGALSTKHEGKCLGIVKDTNVHMQKCHGGRNQKWYIMSNGALKTEHDDKCLTYYAGNVNVDMDKCRGGPNQKWYFKDGHLQTHHDGKCLDSKNNHVYLHKCNAGKNQQWYFDQAPSKSKKADKKDEEDEEGKNE